MEPEDVDAQIAGWSELAFPTSGIFYLPEAPLPFDAERHADTLKEILASLAEAVEAG